MANVQRTGGTKGIDPFAFSLVLAAAAHVLVLGWPRESAPRSFAPDIADVEVDFLDWRDGSADEGAVPEHEHEASRSASPASQLSARWSDAAAVEAGPGAPTGGTPDAALEAEEAPGPDVLSGSAVQSPRRKVRLFLGAADLKELARPKPQEQEQGPASSAALFSGGSESGAEVTASASGPAISAGYRAAQLGPDVGTAVFEVRTDAGGAVTRVQLIGEDDSGFWSLVADELLARLAKSRLRLPAGAKGMVTRLRIDRGYLAEDPGARGRVKRGAALGQDHHPKDFGWDESTQGSTRPGRLAPAAGVSSDSLRTVVPTRVLLLSQQFL